MTLPEIGLWTGAVTRSVESAIFCPMVTESPTATSGVLTAPTCWQVRTMAVCGSGKTELGLRVLYLCVLLWVQDLPFCSSPEGFVDTYTVNKGYRKVHYE